MRVILAAAVTASVVAVTGLVGTVTPVQAQSCAALWAERNSYYKRHGFCFRTAQTIRYFGNAGCFITAQGAVPLTRGERSRVDQIRRIERSLGCTD